MLTVETRDASHGDALPAHLSAQEYRVNRVPIGLLVSPSNQLDLRVDDLTYNVVPEPTAPALLAAITLLFPTRRRR